MEKSWKRNLATTLVVATSAAGSVFGLAATASAAIINAPVPAANYISLDGLDWAWASPCPPDGGSPDCGTFDSVDLTYQGGQGWHFPTLAEFLVRPDHTDFGTVNSFACASNWFTNDYTHCDFQDAALGLIWDYGYGSLSENQLHLFAETWVVRDPNRVPEPGSLLLVSAALLSLFGYGMMRRRADA